MLRPPAIFANIERSYYVANSLSILLNLLIFIIYLLFISFKNHFIILLPLMTNWDIRTRAQSQRANLSGRLTLTILLSITAIPSFISPIMPSKADIRAAAIEEREIAREQREQA